MISGWFSGQPVANAVTKSAEVDRLVSEDFLYEKSELPAATRAQRG
jgi:hypothetical protein